MNDPEVRTTQPSLIARGREMMFRVVGTLSLLFLILFGATDALGQAQVQIIHNSADPAAEVVDIYVEDSGGALVSTLDDVAFRTATSFLDLPADDYDITVAGSNSTGPNDSVISTFNSITLADGETYTVIANGVNNTNDFASNPDGVDTAFDLDIAAGARDAAATTDGDVEIRAVHGSTDAPTVDVLAGGNVFVDDATYTNITGYQGAPAGALTLDVTPGTDNSTVVASFDVDLAPFADTPLTVIASGFLDPSAQSAAPVAPFTLIAVAPDGTVIDLGAAQAQIIHNAADPSAEVVDIYVDGALAADDFTYRTATPFIDLDSGVREIAIAPGNSTGVGDAIATFEEAVPANSSLSILANGVLTPNDFASNPDGVDTAFDLDIAAGARDAAATTDGDVEVRAVHGSTDAPTVDVLAGGNVFVDDATYTNITGYQGAPAGALTLDVTPGTDNSTVVASFDVDLAPFADTPLTVIASGFLNPSAQTPSPVAPFTLIAVAPDGTVIDLGAAQAQIIHNAADPSAEVVDIYVDGALAVDDFTYRTATPFIDLDSGVREIAIAPGTSTGVGDAIATFEEAVPANSSLSILANGVLTPNDFASNPDGVDTAFDLDIAAGARDAAATTDGDVEIRAVHGSTDAPTVDVLAGGNVFVDDATYTNITGYQGAPAGALTLDVTPGTDNSTVVASFDVDLTPFADTPLTVVASGFLDPSAQSAAPVAPFTLIAVAPDGTVINLGSDIFINEFLADPGSLDPNNDGTSGSGDQFVELLNVSTTSSIDLSDYTISTTAGSYTFPSSGVNLSPGQGLVVFAGGTPSGFEVFTGTGLPDLDAENGDTITLADASGNALQVVSFDGSGAQPNATVEQGIPQQTGVSTARDGSGAFVLHSAITANPVSESAGEGNLSAAPLPVELAGFSATVERSAALLTWQTLSETNNSGFEIQQRVDNTFQRVGFVEGQGTTDSETNYRFRISELEPGTHTFRLKQIDLDGTPSLSEPVEVTVSLDGAYALSKLAPNPVSGRGTASLRVQNTQEVTVELFDVLGRQVRTLHEGTLEAETNHQFSVDASSLPSGTYLIRVKGEQFTTTQRISIVR